MDSTMNALNMRERVTCRKTPRPPTTRPRLLLLMLPSLRSLSQSKLPLSRQMFLLWKLRRS
jgi:hypothetical protein